MQKVVVFKTIRPLACGNCSNEIQIGDLAALSMRSALEGTAAIECEPCGTMNVDEVIMTGPWALRPTCSKHNHIACLGCDGVRIKML